MCEKCPVVAAIEKLRVGGFYADEDDYKSEFLVVVGEGEESHEYICDDAIFYLTVRSIDVARLKISKPDLAKCKERFESWFGGVSGSTYAQVYKRILSQSESRKLLVDRFARVMDLLKRLEDWLLLRVHELARAGKPINVTLPDIIWYDNGNDNRKDSPAAVRDMVNQLVDLVNRFNLGSLLHKHKLTKHLPLDDFQTPQPDWSKKVPDFKPTTVDEYIRDMEAMIDIETEVGGYIKAVSKYYCDAINKLGELAEECQKIARDK